MKTGYLALETHPDKPGLVRLIESETDPRLTADSDSPALTRYVLKFTDIDAAFMHAQSAMKRKLVDLNARLYRKPLAEAMGDLDAIELNHELVWQDPDLSEAELDSMEDEVEHRQSRQRQRDRIVQVVKWIAIALLVFNFLAPGINEIMNGPG